MTERSKLTGWRKIAAATWGGPKDPQIFGDLEIDATGALVFMEEAREVSGVKLTMTHMVGKALAHALGEHPDLNCHLYRGRLVRRESADVFFIVSAESGAELSGVKVLHADQKPVVEIAQELARRVEAIRTGNDPEFGKTKKMFAAAPRRLLKLGFKLGSWLTTDLNLDLKRIGLPRDPFGSAMVSSVGMFGIQHAYAPLSPYYRIPFLVLVGEVAPKPTVVDNEIVARPMVTLSATLDHRYLDGFHAARLARSVREYLEDPKRFEPAN
ncbi:MAG: 2-oxo acid dehydrogenase subunit E2 [Actinomycetota bacterium]